MASEARVVRPYLGVDQVQSVLDRVILGFGGRDLEPGSRASVNKLEFLSEVVRLRMADSDEGMEKFAEDLSDAVRGCGLNVDVVELVLLLSSPRLKINDVAWRCSVAELRDTDRTAVLPSGDTRPRALRTPFSGCTARLYVALATSIDEQPLRPHRRGTWLARCDWHITTELGEVGFIPRELTDQVREDHQLDGSTVRFFQVVAPLEPGNADDALEVYVDEDVLHQLAASPGTRGAKALQTQLFLDAMTQAIHAAAQEGAADVNGRPSYEDAEDSLIGRLVTQMCSSGDDVNRDQAEMYWARLWTDPAWLVARVEGWLPGVRRTLLDALGEDDR